MTQEFPQRVYLKVTGHNPLERFSTELGTSESLGNASTVLSCGFKVKCSNASKKKNQYECHYQAVDQINL